MQDILTALAKATSEMKRIAKDSRNIEQKYDFASIDDFLAMAGPICAANGLSTLIDEDEVEGFERQGKYGVTQWLRIRFAFTTYHASGQSLPTTRRTVEVIRTGAQSYGSAQSYALKQYLRGLHMIPTGDKDDADFGEKAEAGAAVVSRERNDSRPKNQDAIDGVHEKAVADARVMIDAAETVDELNAAWKTFSAPVRANQSVIDNGRMRKAVIQAMYEGSKFEQDRRKAELQTKPADDLGGDSLPY